MYFNELFSIHNSYIGYGAKIDPRSHACLIDGEAEGSGAESSSRNGFRNGDTAPHAFPQFVQLPPELRHQIWHFYCPDLSAKARVLPFLEFPTITVDWQNDYSLPDYQALAEQTKTLRAVLSTHRESRSIAVRKYPDELVMDSASGAAIVRFRKETDVIFLMELLTDVDYSMPEFGNEIQNLAVGVVEDFSEERYFYDGSLLKVLPALKGLFPNLRRLFSHWPSLTQPTDMEEWCVTEHVHLYMVRTCYERESGVNELPSTLFCWPDLDAHLDFARSWVPQLCSLEEMEEAGVELWPIVEFESEMSMQLFDMMKRLYWNPPFRTHGRDSPDSEDDESNADRTDADEYGSGVTQTDHHDSMDFDGSSEGELSFEDIGLFSCLRPDAGRVLAKRNVEPNLRWHKRKAIVVDTDGEEEDEMGHDDDGGRPQNKRARLSGPILGFDVEEEEEEEEVEEEEEDLRPDQGG
ncbi:hypothetical protein E4U19_004119 [Claviceps sp. Clav32 group G5]|nr:hypothetical protein E4U19_004119 [Claviceps sp. Clav32 group G5]KAG6040831.1 hypothetical protein E4U39_006862 [Claviceps sp. Clav50 group G5]